MSENQTSTEIQNILDKNKLDDLKRFLRKRQCLNYINSYLIYLFHFIQSAGILATSFAAGNNDIRLVWFGVTLNFLATLISIYEKTNNSILKNLMNDVKSIRDGNYLDEGELINTDILNIQNNKQNVENNLNTTTPLLNDHSNNNTNDANNSV